MDRAERRRRARNVAKHRELMLKQLNKFERRRPIKVGTLRKTLPEMHYRYSWRKTNWQGSGLENRLTRKGVWVRVPPASPLEFRA